MATQYDTQIQQLYVAYFNRPADAAGLAHWAGAMAQGVTAAQISAAFAGSLEYQVEYSQATNAGVVAQVYQNLFGRAPDASGQAFWVKALTDKTMTVENMVTTIAAGAQGTDKVAYDSKVVVATAFTAALDTDAEKAGYSGADANKAAKALLSTIKTAAQATAAVVPAPLDASVAAVVKAATPFSLETGLAALGTAQKAIADFLADAEVLDASGEAIENPDADDVAAYVVDAETDVAALITVGDYEIGVDANADGDYTDATDTAPSLPGVKAALIAEQTSANAKALTAAQKVLTDAQTAVSGVAGLNNAIAAATSADEAATEAAEAAQLAVLAETQAQQSLVVRNSTFTVGGVADSTITLTPKAGGTTVTVAEFKDGAWSIPTGVTAATYPGLTEVVAAQNAAIATAAEAIEAEENLLFANVEVEFRDRSTAGTDALKLIPFASTEGPKPAAGAVPTLAQIRDELNALRSEEKSTTAFVTAVEKFLTDNDAARAQDVIDANTGVKTTQDAITAFEKALSTYDDAKAVAAELKGLTDAYTVALGDFEDNDYVEPSMITGAKFGTTGADIFVFDAAATPAAASITSFGRSGDDVLYVGTGYTLNEGKLTAGVDTALEVFFAQKGANAEITIETKAYGSDSGDVKVITLTGVSIEDLSFNDGIITL